VVEEKRVLIAGGSGTFGRLLAREILATASVTLILAGRDREALTRACRSLDGAGPTQARVLDLADPESFSRAAAGCFAVICAAGPFQTLDRGLPRLAVAAGAHWLDIGDDRGWILSLLENEALDAAARGAGTAVLPGVSTVPGLSGVLARWCRARAPRAVRARVVLWIGNRNRKGAAAIASALDSGFADPVFVRLPVGRVRAWRFRSADEALLARDLGLTAEFRVAFEWGLSSLLVASLQGVGSAERLSRWLSRLSAPTSVFGSDAGCLQVEVFDAEESPAASASLTGKGQRMAVVPAALAIEALLSGELSDRGCVNPAAWLPPEEWITRLGRRGMEFAGTPERPMP
jgi:short subunit dehydrogenase-like uncharacterized protein